MRKTTRTTRAKAALRRARELRAKDDRDAASDAYREAAAAADADEECVYEAALYLADTGHGEEAIALLETANTRFPEHRGMVMSRAEILSELDRDSEADALLESLAAADPDYAWTSVVRAPILMRLDRTGEAEALLDRILGFSPEPEFLEVWVHRLNLVAGEFYQRQRLAPAERLLRRSLALAPDAPSAHDNLGMMLAQGGDPLDGLRHAMRALEIDPENPTVLYNLGWALSHYGAAEAALRRVVEIDPDYPDVYHQLARLYRTMGRDADALEMAREASAHYGTPDAHAELASMLYGTGDIEGADRAARRAIEREPSHALANFVLGDTAASRGDYPEARRRFQAALHAQPDYWMAAMRLARLSAVEGDRAQLLADLSAALNCDIPSTLSTLEGDPAFDEFVPDTDVQALVRSAGLFGGQNGAPGLP